MLLTRNQRTVIIPPKDPTPRERLAVRDLGTYLERIFGIRAVFSEQWDSGANVFLIGGPTRNPHSARLAGPEEFGESLTGEEGMMLRIRGSAALIAGSEGFDDDQRGTLYGVYEFLERFLGCALAAYSAPGVPAGEFVPTYDSLFLEDACYVKAQADRPFRTAIVQYGDAAGDPRHSLNLPFFDWLCKNRYNRILLWASLYEGYKKMGLVGALEERGIRLTVGHHESSWMLLPYDGNEYFPEKYGQTHPEYYRLCEDGTRYRPAGARDPFGQWIFCSRNQDCIGQVSENLIRWIGDNPQVDVVTLWPKDGVSPQCTCEKCSRYSKAENYTYFQNEVAKRVAAVFPRVKIDMCVYADLWECPEGLKLEKNLLVGEATWAADLRTCGKPDGSCLSGTPFEENLLRWKRTGAEVVYYDYYMGVYGNRQRIIPMADEIQSIWRRFQRLGILGAGTQIECFNLWNHLVNLYTFGRTSYNADLSFEDNLAALCRLFGEGAEYVAEAVRLMEETLDGQATIILAGKYMIEHVDKERVYELFERALAAAGDPLARNNIRLMRMAFRYSEIETADPENAHRPSKWEPFQHYEDSTGELAYMCTHYDSFRHNDPGYAIAFPAVNTDCKDFVPDKWYLFEDNVFWRAPD